MKKNAGFILAVTLVWCLLWGSVHVYVVLAGLVLAALFSVAYRRAFDVLPAMRFRWRTMPRFACYFVKILVQSNFAVMKIVLRPGFKEKPRIVRLDTAPLTPAQVTMLASVITLTPGTLSLDVSEDGRWLSVHAMSGADRDAVMRDLIEIKSRLMSEVFE